MSTVRSVATRSCSVCGHPLETTASVCLECGHLHPLVPNASKLPSERRLLPALLLCLLIGVFGAHRFYAGRTVSGVLQFLTLGGLGIWWLADVILLATGQFRDREGARITEWT